MALEERRKQTEHVVMEAKRRVYRNKRMWSSILNAGQVR